jgi:hypothetical protein
VEYAALGGYRRAALVGVLPAIKSGFFSNVTHQIISIANLSETRRDFYNDFWPLADLEKPLALQRLRVDRCYSARVAARLLGY